MKYAGLALAFASTAFSQSLTEALGSQPGLSQLASLINSTGLASNLSMLTNVTLLAPNNDAISAFMNSPTGGALATDSSLVSAILSYHVLQGNYSNITNTSFIPTMLMPPQYANVTGGQVVEALPAGMNVTFFSGLLSNSSVVNASIPFSGGTIHIIDRFLTIPQNVSTTAVALNLTSAVGAVTALNLTGPLDNTPDLTLFLPNNAAFQRIGGNFANLSTMDLTGILSYHAVAGSVLYSTDIMNGSSVPALAGGNLTITVDNGTVFVNNAEVLTPNVLVANGVIHVIDRVLNPGNATIAPNTATTEDAFPATSATDEPFTSGVPMPTSVIATESVASAEASASSAQSSSSSGGAWRPVETGAMGMAALFGGAAAVMNM